MSAVFWTLASVERIAVDPRTAVVVHDESRVLAVLGPGEHPCPAPARLTAVSTAPLPAWRWGMAEGARVGTEEVRAFGRVAVRVGQVTAAFERFGRAAPLHVDQLGERVARMVAGRFAAALPELTRALDLDDAGASASLSEAAAPRIGAALTAAGLQLLHFQVEGLTRPRSEPVSRPPARLVPCGECLAPVVAGARFCPTCGAARPLVCAGCGTSLPGTAKFCARCGTGTGPTPRLPG